MIRVRAPQDFGAALLFLAIGTAGLALGAGLPGMQRGGQPGSGTLPFILSLTCLGFGAFMLLRSVRFNGPPVVAPPWRALACVVASVVTFAALIGPLGYVATAILSPLVAPFAWPGMRWRERLIVSAALGIGTSLLFIAALGQPLDPW